MHVIHKKIVVLLSLSLDRRCAHVKERLVRRNIWKYAVNHIPDYRDTVDLQVCALRDAPVARVASRVTTSAM